MPLRTPEGARQSECYPLYFGIPAVPSTAGKDIGLLNVLSRGPRGAILGDGLQLTHRRAIMRRISNVSIVAVMALLLAGCFGPRYELHQVATSERQWTDDASGGPASP